MNHANDSATLAANDQGELVTKIYENNGQVSTTYFRAKPGSFDEVANQQLLAPPNQQVDHSGSSSDSDPELHHQRTRPQRHPQQVPAKSWRAILFKLAVFLTYLPLVDRPLFNLPLVDHPLSSQHTPSSHQQPLRYRSLAWLARQRRGLRVPGKMHAQNYFHPHC